MSRAETGDSTYTSPTETKASMSTHGGGAGLAVAGWSENVSYKSTCGISCLSTGECGAETAGTSYTWATKYSPIYASRWYVSKSSTNWASMNWTYTERTTKGNAGWRAATGNTWGRSTAGPKGGKAAPNWGLLG